MSETRRTNNQGIGTREHVESASGSPTLVANNNGLLANNLGKSFKKRPVLRGVSLAVQRGEAVGLLGPNGAGKSTLIKTLNAELSLLAGDKVDGANLKTGYFSQRQLDELRPEASAVDHLAELGRRLGELPTEQTCRDFLGKFNFHGDKVFEPVATFSGGEKARLALGLITFSKPNLLLLDEPTNHLDLWAREALENCLREFNGTVVLVSHDRYFLNRVVDHMLVVQGTCLLYTSPSPRDLSTSRMPSSA